MNFEHIDFNITEALCNITLNRPEVFNALHSGILKELTVAVNAAADNEAIRVIVLTGAGDKAFCSGADLKAGIKNAGTPLGETLKENYEPAILAMRNCPKPIICKLNGVAAGAGMSLALACDIIIADETTYMTELFVGIGLMPDAGSMYFLPRLVGMQRTFEICSTGRKIYMKEALAIGLVTKTVATAELDTAVAEFVAYYSTAATKAIAQMKKVLNLSYQSSLQEVLDLEAAGQTKCGLSNDFGEGVMSFMQKRAPKFKGN